MCKSTFYDKIIKMLSKMLSLFWALVDVDLIIW